MDQVLINSSSKTDLLNLFKMKDITDNGATRDFLSDVFYDFEHWPVTVLRDFFLIKHVNRMRITNFCYGNGMSPYIFEIVMTFYHEKISENQNRLKEMKILWKRLEEQCPAHYYYYSMELKSEIYFDNRLRQNSKKGTIHVMRHMFNTSESCTPNDYYFENIHNLTYNIKRNILRLQEERSKARRKIIKEAAKKKKIKMAAIKNEDEKTEYALAYLKLESIDDLFSDGD